MPSSEGPPSPEPTEQQREVAGMLVEQQESDRGCVIFARSIALLPFALKAGQVAVLGPGTNIGICSCR
jgi:hypothetical protein